MTLPAAQVPGSLGPSTFPSLASDTPGVCPCGCMLNLKESRWAMMRQKEIQLCVTRSAASPGSARGFLSLPSDSQYLHLQMSLHHFPAWPEEGFKGCRRMGFHKGACKPRYSWCLLPRKVQTWTFPDLRKFRKPKAFPRLAFQSASSKAKTILIFNKV